jgi:IclR family transcriptional regulator, KDG regulon repressor
LRACPKDGKLADAAKLAHFRTSLEYETLVAMPQLEILTSFDQNPRPASAADIIERTGLPRSTVFRGLKLLIAEGFVHQDATSKRYTLGPRMLQLGMVARRQLGSEDIVAGPLVTLGNRTQETITLSILDLPSRICVFVLEAPSDLRHVVQVGARYPLHLGAAGKAILAYLPTDVVRPILEGNGLSRTQIAAMEDELKAIRTQGWATTTGERVAGATTIAAPVVVGGMIFGSVAVVGPSDRMMPKFEAHRPLVIESANTISRLLSPPESKSVATSSAPSRSRQRPRTAAVR